jgi:sigma-B regulation protein RsbU (phosphoserine phosphatase)
VDLARVEASLVRALAETSTPADAAERVLPLFAETVNGRVAILWLTDDDAGLLQRTSDWCAEPGSREFVSVSRRLTFAPGTGLPGRAWAAGVLIWSADVTADPDFPREAAARDSGLRGAIEIPLRSSGAVHGVLEVLGSALPEPDEPTRRLLQMLGDQVGQFLARLSIEQRLAATEELSASIVSAALECIITMGHDGRVIDFNPAAQEVFGYRREDAVGQPLSELIIPPEYRELHRAALARFIATEEPTILNRRLELTGMRADGSTFPVELTVTRVGTRRPPRFAGFLRDITQRKASERELNRLLGGEHAARVRAEAAELRARQVSEALQRSLLPPHLPAIPGMELSAAYRAGTADSVVGGDFYDVLGLGEGRWGIAIGDVAGKGPEAASITGLARYTLRTAAAQHAGPADVLRALNEALLREGADHRLCTAVFGILSSAGPHPTLRLAIGGHPSPLLLRADGTVETVGAPGTLLGATPSPVFHDQDIALAAGDALLLYTDGVTEARTADGRFGLERLKAVLAGCAGLGAAQLADRVERTVGELGDPTAGGDDVALLVLRAAPE